MKKNTIQSSAISGRDVKLHWWREVYGDAGVRHTPIWVDGFCTENGVKLKTKAAILSIALTAAGCTDLKPMEARIEDLQEQVNKLQGDLAKSTSTAAAANKATAASASAASGDAKQALSIAESNTAAIEKLNAKIDQMFRKRPAE
jgi:type II secretory pathway component PulM